MNLRLSQALLCDNRFCADVAIVAKGDVDNSTIRQRMRALNLRQADLADALGIEQDKVSKSLGGTRQWKAAEFVKLSELLDVQSHRSDRSTPLDELAIEHGLIFLDEIDLPLGMGATYLNGNPEVLGIVPFKEDWLRGLHEGSLDRLKVTRGRGDSMQPTIVDGDIVIVDTAHRRVDDQDRIWAIAYGDLGMIRRIRVTPRGSWLLMPDNQIVRPDEVGDGEVAVIGRVIWIGRRI